MPRTLPDGRVESPGVVRIYIASMAILAFFYACSAVVQVSVDTCYTTLSQMRVAVSSWSTRHRAPCSIPVHTVCHQSMSNKGWERSSMDCPRSAS